MFTGIRAYIHRVRLQLANHQLLSGFLFLLNGLLPILLVITAAEALFYMEIEVRSRLVTLVILLLAVAVLYLLLRWIIHRYSLFGNSSDEMMTDYVGQRVPGIADRLTNAYQLQEIVEGGNPGKDLAELAVSRVHQQLTEVPPESIRESHGRKLLLTAGILLAAVTIIFLAFYPQLTPAANRLAHPNTPFPVPLPFTLSSITGNQDVLGGDTLQIAFTGEGELPDSVTIHWRLQEVERTITVPAENNIYTHQLQNINSDIVYWSNVTSRSIFTPWSQISTPPDTIFVTDRPVVEDLRFTIVPPGYTGEDPWEHPGNVTDVTVVSGSQVRVDSRSTKPLTMAWALVGDRRKPLEISGNRIRGTFSLTEDQPVSIFCLDENDVGNLNPAQYRFTVIPDYPPDLLIAKPDRESDLDEDLMLHFSFQTSDDYGFSAAEIQYRVKHPDYLSQDTTIYVRVIPELILDARTQQVFHSWDLEDLNLAPEDELRFQLRVIDNNRLTGPSATTSAVYIAHYPSLEDLFMSLSEDQETTEEESQEILMTLEDVKDLVEELELDLLKAEDVNWEETQKSEEVLQKMENVMEQIQDMQEGLEKMTEQMEKNDLVNNELQEKFSKLQELLDQIITPELAEAMEKLREAMDQMDPEQMLQALENLDFNMQEMEEQLDRFIDMFQQAMAEQKMDEVVKRLEEMVAEQNDIMEEMNKDESQTFSELASRERRQEEKFDRVEEIMKDAAKAIEPYAEQPSQELNDLQNSELTEQTGENLQEAREQMQNSSPKSQEPAGEAQEGLQEMLETAQSIQEKFQEQTVAEMMQDFTRVMQNTLAISQSQEHLRNSSTGLRSNSPLLPEIAVSQDRIRRQTNQLLVQLMDLSRKTFYISPPISRALGKARTAMDQSIAKVEQKSISTSLREQKTAMEGLNEAARFMLDAMEQMQASGSASGFEAFMEQMEQMSQQQQGINQGTMQLGQMGMMAQQEMMRRLQAQQQQLQQSLNELLSEMPGQDSGGLGKASDEMEEVIKDFKRRQVTRRTTERQERILSRMLDSQKSLTQRDYSKKRKSNTGEEFIYSGPAGLPTGLGERDMLLIQAMEDALNEGYSREYQNMLKTYFRELQKTSEEPGIQSLEDNE